MPIESWKVIEKEMLEYTIAIERILKNKKLTVNNAGSEMCNDANVSRHPLS